MSLFKRYLAESVRNSEYHFRIKTIAPLTEENITRLENHLKKYDAVLVQGPRKTPIQESPLDFRDASNVEVTIFDAVLTKPTTSQMLQKEICSMWNIGEGMVVVRTDNDPIELQNEELNFNQQIQNEKKEGAKMAPLLSTLSEYNEDEQIENNTFGDDYNKKFLSRLAQVKAENEKKQEKIAPSYGIEQVSEKIDAVDFNKEYNTVKPVSKGSKDAVVEKNISPAGNLDDDNKKFVKKTNTGKKIERKSNNIRKD